MRRTGFIVLIILTACLTISAPTALCQSSFTFKYSTASDEVPFHAVETDDGMYIVSAKIGDYQSLSYNTMLIKLDENGDTVKTLQISKSPESCVCTEIIKSNDGNFLCCGIRYTSQKAFPWLLKINADLKVLLDTTYFVGMRSIGYLFGFINHENYLTLYGSGEIDPINDDPFILELSQSGDSLQFKYFPDDGDEYVYSMIEKNDSLGYYMAIFGKYQINLNSWGQLLTIDTNLNVTKINAIPNQLQLFYNMQSLNKDQLFLTGKTTIMSGQGNQQLLGILKLDTSFQVQDSLYFGPYDTINYPGYFHNLSFIDTNKVYYGGTCNQSIAGDFSSNNSFFLLGCLSSTLDKKWEKYIGGDMYYTLWGVVATNDMGCLLLGCTYDYLTQNMERDILIIKVDSTGIMTSTNGHDIQLCDAMVYPNPGTDYLYIRSGPQIKGARMVIHDINGKQVSESVLDQELQQVDTRSFLPGTYVWQIIFNNRAIQTGKWIKGA